MYGVAIPANPSEVSFTSWLKATTSEYIDFLSHCMETRTVYGKTMPV